MIAFCICFGPFGQTASVADEDDIRHLKVEIERLRQELAAVKLQNKEYEERLQMVAGHQLNHSSSGVSFTKILAEVEEEETY